MRSLTGNEIYRKITFIHATFCAVIFVIYCRSENAEVRLLFSKLWFIKISEFVDPCRNLDQLFGGKQYPEHS